MDDLERFVILAPRRAGIKGILMRAAREETNARETRAWGERLARADQERRVIREYLSLIDGRQRP